MNKDTVRYLIGQYMNDALTAEQQEELLQLLGHQNETELITVLRDMMETESAQALAVDAGVMQASLQRILDADKAVQHEQPARVVTMGRRWRWIAAAACFIGLSVTAYLLFNKKDTVPEKRVSVSYENDVQPGGDKAVLTLANGKQIVLDSAANGKLAQEGSTQISKDGESLTYDAGSAGSEVTYNLLSTPNGGQYKLTLPDGSKVWLNAASSIKYPTAFAGRERRVEISGEVYFEVMKNAKMPFRVQLPAGKGEVEVLGTRFNVNAYNDEETAKTTLLEGKVKVRQWSMVNGQSASADAAAAVVLKPGQQAVLSRALSPLTIDHSPDLEQVIAWTNGMFIFRDQRIENIMRQLSRWYDVEVSYSKGPITEGFNATIPRNVPVSKVLRLLELTTLVHFKIEGKKITVLP
jgi:transmembrane sensor